MMPSVYSPALVPVLLPGLTCLEVGLQHVGGEGDGPVQDPGHAPGQDDLGSAELGHAVREANSRSKVSLMVRTVL